MTDREKLAEMLMQEIFGSAIIRTEDDVKFIREKLIKVADHLLANGVVAQEWIPVAERLPEERDSIFKKLYGTKQWLPGMFCTVSDNVLASIEREDGTRCVRYMHTQGGEWNLDSMPWAKEVTHWMPLPAPPKEDE